MERRTCLLLTVLTLLQQCRAEISDSSQENWYAANVINDGFHPKPLSEIFSTQTPFSSTNPIIVLPTSSPTPNEPIILSTSTPRNKISSTTSSPSSDLINTSLFSSPSTTALPPTLQTLTIPDFSLSSKTPAVETTQYTESMRPPSLSLTVSQPTTVPQDIEQTTNLALSEKYAPTQSQQIKLEVMPQGAIIPVQYQPVPISDPQQQLSTATSTPPSNYFLIYQQAPQSVQGLPSRSLEVSSTLPPPSIGSTLIIQPAPTVSSITVPSTMRTTTSNCQNLTNTNLRLPYTQGPLPIRIRVVAPRGSITNVNINPPTSSTTKRPVTTRITTTKRPKTPKPRKNSYDACMHICRGRKEPICAVPLSSNPIDPATLKGFPSICHMACHNSYRKDPYEKILDGRCGRLRTRIKTVDSNNKLKRDELNKAQYFIDGDKTVIEVQALH